MWRTLSITYGGRQSTVIMAHASLQWLNRMKETNLALQFYPFAVINWKGRQHTSMDFFSQQAIWNALDQQAGL